MATNINLKRAYDPQTSDDGYRVYIDRLWPRGLSHENFKYDRWDKEIAPSAQLREWFHANPAERWNEFSEKYRSELNENPAFLDLADAIKNRSKVTLLFSSHDREHNNAVVVKKALENM